MTLDDETRAVLMPDVWAALTWALATQTATNPHGGSEPTVGGDRPATMLSVAVPTDIVAHLDRIAARRGVSRSDIVRCGLALVIARDAEWVRGHEALADVDRS